MRREITDQHWHADLSTMPGEKNGAHGVEVRDHVEPQNGRLIAILPEQAGDEVDHAHAVAELPRLLRLANRLTRFSSLDDLPPDVAPLDTLRLLGREAVSILSKISNEAAHDRGRRG